MKVGTILEQWLACRHGARCSEVKQAAPADTMLAAFEVKQVVSAGEHAGSTAQQDDCSRMHSCSRAPAAAYGQCQTVATDSTCQHAQDERQGDPGLAADAQQGEPLLCWCMTCQSQEPRQISCPVLRRAHLFLLGLAIGARHADLLCRSLRWRSTACCLMCWPSLRELTYMTILWSRMEGSSCRWAPTALSDCTWPCSHFAPHPLGAILRSQLLLAEQGQLHASTCPGT